MRPKGAFRSIRCLRFQCEVLHLVEKKNGVHRTYSRTHLSF